MSTLTQNLKTVNFDGLPVAFTNSGYLNATMIAKHYGKRVQHYLSNERTQDYICALNEHLGEAVKTASEQTQLVIIVKGGKHQEQGTWLHPKLAIDFARWLNPRFAVWCDMQIDKIANNQHYALLDEFNKAVLTLEELETLASNAGRALSVVGKQLKPKAKDKVITLQAQLQFTLPQGE